LRSISVIIPTVNEADYLPRALLSLSKTRSLQTIVADGGSSDETLAIAKTFAAEVLECTRGRARQMNSAARIATGDILLFLHADTTLPENWDQHIRTALDEENVCGGAFSLAIEGVSPSLRVVESLANFRTRIFHMPYGDQGIFVKTATFLEIGGFPDIAIMEDFEFIRRLCKRYKIRILPERVITSGRRWKELGIFKTTAINQAMIIGYYGGISPDKLARFYSHVSRPSERPSG
jgi:rSAM/selenodomain-associated transferase 2